MKKFRIILQLMFLSGVCQGQLEIKTSAISPLIDIYDVNIEFAINDDFGIDGDYIFGKDDDLIFIGIKHYLKPEKNLDRFYINPFIFNQQNDMGYGFGLGYKMVSDKNVIFEFGTGLGKDFGGDNYVFQYKLHLGIRIDKVTSMINSGK